MEEDLKVLPVYKFPYTQYAQLGRLLLATVQVLALVILGLKHPILPLTPSPGWSGVRF